MGCGVTRHNVAANKVPGCNAVPPLQWSLDSHRRLMLGQRLQVLATPWHYQASAILVDDTIEPLSIE